MKSRGLLRQGDVVAVYRFMLTEKALGVWPVAAMGRALQVCTSAYYQWAKDPAATERSDPLLRVHIRAIHRKSRKTYGAPRIHAELQEEGHRVARKRVARLMQEEQLSGVPTQKVFRVSTTLSEHEDPIADNLLQRNFTVEPPNQAWVGDITYLRTPAGFVYLAVIVDLHSRRVVGWAIRDHMRTRLVLEALDRAVALRRPGAGRTHHTDRGSQYASVEYRSALDTIGAVPSMRRKGDCWDNAVAESFFGTLEQEWVKQSREGSGLAEARSAVIDYIVPFYTHERRHSTLGQKSPVVFERYWKAANQQTKAA
ncbi:MAG: putative transposase [Myxococcota bacterium]